MRISRVKAGSDHIGKQVFSGVGKVVRKASRHAEVGDFLTSAQLDNHRVKQSPSDVRERRPGDKFPTRLCKRTLN